MSPITGLARLTRPIFSSFHMGNLSLVTVHMGNFSSVTEMNMAQPFKFHPDNRAGVFIWEHFQPGCRDLGCKSEISITGLARLLI